MKKITLSLLPISSFIGVALSSLSPLSYAQNPVWTFTPVPGSPPTVIVPFNGRATIQYTVTNSSHKRHTLVLQPLPAGITQNTGAGNCPSPFTLDYQQSCTLTLNVNGSTLQGNVMGGPKACQINPNGTPNPNQCYQPSEANSLKITLQQYAYIADLNGNMYQCSLNANGSFNSCSTTPVTPPLWQPAAISFSSVQASYGYVADAFGNVFQCNLNTNGSFNSCSKTPTSAPAHWKPWGIAFTTINSTNTQYGYVSDYSQHKVDQCTLNPNGSFASCSAMSGSFGHPDQIAFATIGGNQYAYVTDNDGYVHKCALNSSGHFTSCDTTPSSPPNWWYPTGIAFATVNGTQYAYISTYSYYNSSTTTYSPPYIYQCSLNSSDGSFSSCTIAYTGSSCDNFANLAFATFAGTQYAYVANGEAHFFESNTGGSNMYQCSLGATGIFTSCISTPSSGAPATWIPHGIAFH